MKLTESRISDWSQFSHVPELQVLLEYAKVVKIPLAKPQVALGWGDPLFETLTWRPSELTFEFEQPTKSTTNTQIFFHACMHYLVYRLAPIKSLRGWPETTLLSECVAASFDIFLIHSLCNSGQAGHPFVKNYIKKSSRFFEVHPSYFRQVFSQSDDGFRLYSTCVQETFTYVNSLFKWTQNPVSNQITRKRIRDMNNKLKYPLLFKHLNYGSFVLYAHGVCGLKSKPNDKMLAKKIIAYLDQSKTMLEFLARLQDGASVHEK